MRTVLPAPKSAWVALAAALVFHILSISVTANHRAGTSVLRTLLLDGLASIERLTDGAVSGVGGIWRGYVALVDLQAENGRLRKENERLRMQWTENREQLNEAARIRALAGFEAAGVGKTVVARVIGRDTSTGRQTLTLNRGQSSGIQKDTPVITPDGVVGRVVTAGQFSSIVQSITDAESAIGILAGDARQQGILKGNGARLLDLDYIDDDSFLKAGDTFVTSGMDKIYPKGLPVGTAVTVGHPEDGGLFKKVTIRTAVDFGRLEEVLCVVERSQNLP